MKKKVVKTTNSERIQQNGYKQTKLIIEETFVLY